MADDNTQDLEQSQEDAAEQNAAFSGVEEPSDTQENTAEEEGEEQAASRQASCVANEGEQNADTPKEEIRAAYEADGWQAKVEEFFAAYPTAKGFASMIGEQIVSDETLARDENCLEKALARVFDKVYVPPKDLVKDQEFLEKYVYSDENIKSVIVERYLDELENSRPPRSISSRGKITLTPPDKPKSIAEAGNLIKTMLNNRRI